MKKGTALALSLVCGTMLAQESGEPVKIPADKTRFHIILMIGQSNMVGRGHVDYADRPIHPRVLVQRKGQWEQAMDPLTPLVDEKTGKRRGGGLGPAFARAYAEAFPDVTVGIVMRAAGGTKIEQWKCPDALCYRNAVLHTRNAMKDGTLKVILWHQGESDMVDDTPEYHGKLKQLIADLRKDFGNPDLPFVLGEVPAFSRNVATPGYTNVTQAIRRIPAEVPNTALVSAEGLTDNGDRLHISTESQIEFGKRYFAAYTALVQKAGTSPSADAATAEQHR